MSSVVVSLKSMCCACDRSHGDELQRQLTEALTSLEPARQVCKLISLLFCCLLRYLPLFDAIVWEIGKAFGL